MKISRIDLNHLRNDAHFQLHTEFRDLVAKEGPEALKIEQQFNAYLSLYEREDEALKKIAKSEFTAKIHDADKARDDIFTSLAEVTRGMCRHFNPEIKDAARRLRIVFDSYGDVAHKSINEETSAIFNMLQDLKGKYAADVAAMGIAQGIAELEAGNNAVEALVKKRFDESAAKTDIVLREARRELDKAYNSITERIDALIVIEGVSVYETFVKTLNVVIAKYAALHHHRRKRLSQDSQPTTEVTQ